MVVGKTCVTVQCVPSSPPRGSLTHLFARRGRLLPHRAQRLFQHGVDVGGGALRLLGRCEAVVEAVRTSGGRERGGGA
jgi:hypothetical protein